MDRSLPLPHFESEGLEDGYCQHHEGGADETCTDGFFVTFVHMGYKSSTFSQNNQTIRHISAIYPSIYHTECSPRNGEMASAGGAIHHIFMQNIPEIWRDKQYTITLHPETFN